MVKDSKTDVFGNYDFLQKNQNFEWKTTLTLFRPGFFLSSMTGRGGGGIPPPP